MDEIQKKNVQKCLMFTKKRMKTLLINFFPKNRVRNVFDLFALHKLEDVFECDSSQTVL